MGPTKSRLLDEETWERIRNAFLVDHLSILRISMQPWAPSRPTVIKCVNSGISVRTASGVVNRPPIKDLQPVVQATARAAEGAARMLGAAQSNDRPAPDRPPGALDPNEPQTEVITGVLREFARLDGAQALAEETAMMREGKATAHELLVLARSMAVSARIIQAKVAVALQALEIRSPMDVLIAVKINGTIALTADRATRVAERVTQLERKLLGDPRDATGATGTPGETFAMTTEEALAEAHRCAHVLERYGVPLAVGSRAEIRADVVNQKDVPAEEPPSVFVGARDDEQEDEPEDEPEQTDAE